jgi:hypothetical protein
MDATEFSHLVRQTQQLQETFTQLIADTRAMRQARPETSERLAVERLANRPKTADGRKSSAPPRQ